MDTIEKIGKEKQAIWKAFYRGKSLRGMQPIFGLGINTLSRAFSRYEATLETEAIIDRRIKEYNEANSK